MQTTRQHPTGGVETIYDKSSTPAQNKSLGVEAEDAGQKNACLNSRAQNRQWLDSPDDYVLEQNGNRDGEKTDCGGYGNGLQRTGSLGGPTQSGSERGRDCWFVPRKVESRSPITRFGSRVCVVGRGRSPTMKLMSCTATPNRFHFQQVSAVLGAGKQACAVRNGTCRSHDRRRGFVTTPVATEILRR